MKKISFSDILVSFKKQHSNRYDYSKAIYKNGSTKMDIICREHGVFKQAPDQHKKGQGCPKCAGNVTCLKEDFIKSAQKIHGDKYEYISYTNTKVRVRIICKIHGEFKQESYNHLNGSGCPKCAGELVGKINTKSHDEILKRFIRAHGDKYDYSKFKYVGAHTKAKIICRKHGLFEQRIHDHSRGIGCPICSSSKGELKIIGFLQQNGIDFKTQYKFKNLKQLRFDFYLPDYNICIEYDGIQHFKPVDFFGGVKSFKILKDNDRLKDIYCKNNNIRLIRINYKQFKKLDKILSKIKEIYENCNGNDSETTIN